MVHLYYSVRAKDLTMVSVTTGSCYRLNMEVWAFMALESLFIPNFLSGCFPSQSLHWHFVMAPPHCSSNQDEEQCCQQGEEDGDGSKQEGEAVLDAEVVDCWTLRGVLLLGSVVLQSVQYLGPDYIHHYYNQET